MKIKKLAGIFFAILVSAGLLCGCGAGGGSVSSGGASTGSAVKARKIVIAASPGYKPITYTDENGVLDGYDIAVFKKIDELLPEYEFVFEVADKETLNIGVETGKYQIGLNGLFRSAEREEKYLIPENNLGATRVGFVVREDRNDINTWDDLVTRKVAPTTASGGIYGQLTQYNNAHPDKPIKFDVVTSSNRASNYAALRDNTYDAVVELIDVYNQIDDKSLLTGVKITKTASKVNTYPIINKSETELAATINTILKTLRGDGTLSKIALEYYGADVFAE
jgi:ABC-type amino acid transport substrate-binding protein